MVPVGVPRMPQSEALVSWRRYDDGFEDNPKILELVALAGYEAFYRLCKVHGFSAKYGTKGIVKSSAVAALGVRPKHLRAMIQVGLLHDRGEGTYEIHDWADYQPKDLTGAERQARFRNAHRNGEVTEEVTETTVTESLPRARASAPVPVLSRKEPYLAAVGGLGDLQQQDPKSHRGDDAA